MASTIGFRMVCHAGIMALNRLSKKARINAAKNNPGRINMGTVNRTSALNRNDLATKSIPIESTIPIAAPIKVITMFSEST